MKIDERSISHLGSVIGEAEAENDEEGRALEIADVVDLEVVVMKSTDVAGENLLIASLYTYHQLLENKTQLFCLFSLSLQTTEQVGKVSI